MQKPLLTHEMGSLAKPGWRVKGYAGKAVSEADVEDARAWAGKDGVDGSDELLALLRRAPL